MLGWITPRGWGGIRLKKKPYKSGFWIILQFSPVVGQGWSGLGVHIACEDVLWRHEGKKWDFRRQTRFFIELMNDYLNLVNQLTRNLTLKSGNLQKTQEMARSSLELDADLDCKRMKRFRHDMDGMNNSDSDRNAPREWFPRRRRQSFQLW